MSFQRVRLAKTSLRALLLVSAALAGPAFAQDAEHVETDVDELVVTGSRKLPNSVAGDIAPELILSPREIRAYGAANLTELLDALAPQTASGQGSGRPVVLLNGGRVSGFAEIRDLPTEAVARVDILPEEVSLRYGYPADQKVVNVVLRQRFRATLAEGSATTPTQSGGGETLGAHAGKLHILRGRRMMLDARSTWTSQILESDRDLVDSEGDFRSLQPKSSDVTLNAVLAQPLGDGVTGSINGVFQATESQSRLGLSPFTASALTRKSTAQDGRIAASAAGALAGWQWSYTGELARNDSRSTTERALGGQLFRDRARAVTTSLQSDVVASKALWRLPAGQVSAAFTARASTTELESYAARLGVMQSSDLTRTTGQLQANFDAPITKAGQGLGAAIGKLSANANVSLQNLSDFGGLETVGGGLNWTPVSPVQVVAAYSRTDQAPTMNQLGDPVLATPGVRVFDLTRGETAEVVRISGGSPDLEAGRKDVFKLGVTYKPLKGMNLTFQANYVSSRIHDGIASFPSASTQVEAAFPERFLRDPAGSLIQVDARPVNFALQARDELRWGFTYSRRVGPQPTPDQIQAMRRRVQEERAAREGQGRQGGQSGDGPRLMGPDGGPPSEPPPRGEGELHLSGRPPGDGPGSGGGGPGMGGGGGGNRGFGGPGGPGGQGFRGFGGGPRGGVFQIGLYHTVAFRDDVLIRPGVPVLDLLDGAAIGSGGGSPRHQVDLQANYSRSGLGVAMNAKWQSDTRIVGGADGDLTFSDLTTVNLRLFADIGVQPWAREHRWLRGTRATLSINNLFDTRQRVRTASGEVPITYQPDLLDPVGRSVRLTLRKLIF